MTIGAALTKTSVDSQLNQDAQYLQEVYAWLKRKQAEYATNATAVLAVEIDANDQATATTFYQSLGRVIAVFEGVAPTGTANIVNNLAQIVGIA